MAATQTSRTGPGTFDVHSPERGWPPFLDWLKSEGIGPDNLVSLTIDEDRCIVATFQAYDRHGELQVDRSRDEVCTYQRTGIVRTLPPLHPDRET